MASQLFHPVRPQKHAAESSPQTSENSSFLRSWTRKRREARTLVPCLFKPCLLLDTTGFAAVRLSRHH
jgi:hypothetical protein